MCRLRPHCWPRLVRLSVAHVVLNFDVLITAAIAVGVLDTVLGQIVGLGRGKCLRASGASQGTKVEDTLG